MSRGLQKQNISIPLMGGLDTKTDDVLLKPGDWVQLNNAVRQKAGTLKKTTGFDPLSTSILPSGSISSADRLKVFKNELLLISFDQLYSYYQDQTKWVLKGYVSPCIAESEDVSSENIDQRTPDHDVLGNIQLIAWQETNAATGIDIYASAIDLTNGNHILDRTKVNSSGNANATLGVSANVRVATNGSKIYVFYIDSAGPNLKYREYRPSTNDFGTLTTLVSVNAVSVFDVVGFSGGIGVAYSTLATTVRGEIFDTSFVSVGGVTKTDTPQSLTCLGISKNSTSTRFCITWQNSGNKNPKFFEIDNTGTGITATTSIVDVSTLGLPTTVFNQNTKCGSIYDATSANIYFFYDFKQTSGSVITYSVGANNYNIAGLSLGSGGIFHGNGVITSKPFIRSGTIYINTINYGIAPVGTTAGITRLSYYTWQWDPTTEAARVVCHFRRKLANSWNSFPKTILIGTDSYVFVNQIVSRLDVTGINLFATSGIALMKTVFDSTDKYQSVEIGNNLLFAGGVVKSYDGKGVTELGFFHEPAYILAADAGAGSIGAGTYAYKAVYEWTDNHGQIHRSAPSGQVLITIAASHNVTITVPIIFETEKSSAVGSAILPFPRTDIRIRVYRTANLGTIFYFTGYVLNTNGIFTTVTDSSTDAIITAQEQLYITSGEVENESPPSCRSICSVVNRCFVFGLEDKGLFWFSKEFVLDEGIQFAGEFTRRADQSSQLISGDALVAAIGMDEKLIMFKGNSILFMAGNGPLNTGLQDDFTQVQLISSDVGILDPLSLILTPIGIMFKSAKGIYLLDRSLQTSYKGAEVESFNSLTITSATSIANLNEVRFTTSAGQMLIFNTFFNEWSTRNNISSIGAVFWNSKFVHGKSNGIVNVDNGVFTDNTAALPMLFETGWLKLDQIEGYQRIRRLLLEGDWKSDHTLKIDVYYDYQKYIQDTYLLTPFAAGTYPVTSKPSNVNLYAEVNDGVYQFEIHLKKQKCQAIKFVLTDQPVAPFGESFQIKAFTAEVAVKQGTFPIQSNKRGIAQ